MDRYFKNEVFSSFDPSPVQTCATCGSKTRLLHRILDPTNGRTIRIFKCACGEQIWTETKQQ
ncbi:hypothetical protein ACVWWO_000743 [Bradyrhizobium sp. F1.13.1]